MTQALYLSFTEYNVLQPARWVGLENYQRLVSDPAFHNALLNTLYYAAVTTPLSVGLALGLAILLNRRARSGSSASRAGCATRPWPCRR